MKHEHVYFSPGGFGTRAGSVGLVQVRRANRTERDSAVQNERKRERRGEKKGATRDVPTPPTAVRFRWASDSRICLPHSDLSPGAFLEGRPRSARASPRVTLLPTSLRSVVSSAPKSYVALIYASTRYWPASINATDYCATSSLGSVQTFFSPRYQN